MKSIFISLFALLAIASLIYSLNVVVPIQLTDVKNSSNDTISGSFKYLLYDAPAAGNLIHTELFGSGIVNGSVNLLIGENTSNTLSLEYMKPYYFDFELNGESATFTDINGALTDRQIFYSPFGLVNATLYVMNDSITNNTLERNINLSNATGYLGLDINLSSLQGAINNDRINISNFNFTFGAKAGNATCPIGQFVVNTTTTGVQCDTPSGTGTVVEVNGDGKYIYNGSSGGIIHLEFNETELNNTIWKVSSLFGNLTNYYNKTTIDTNLSILQTSINNDRINISNLNSSLLAIDTNISALQGAVNNDRINISNFNTTFGTKAGNATCPVGTVVQNTTITGVQCIAAGGVGTVTSVATDSSMFGGPITSTGTLGVNLSNLTANFGNWTADKVSYWTSTQIDNSTIVRMNTTGGIINAQINASNVTNAPWLTTESEPRWSGNESRVANLEINMSNMNTTMNEAISNISSVNSTTIHSIQGDSYILAANGTITNLSANLTAFDERYLAARLRLYFYNTSSTLNSSYTVMNSSVNPNLQYKSFATMPNGQNALAARIYEVNLTSLPAGVYVQHTSINVTASGVDRIVRMHSELYILAVNGTERLIGTSVPSDPLIVSPAGVWQDVDFIGTIVDPQNISAGEHLVMRLNATVSGSGVSPSIQVIVGGTTGASLNIGVDPADIIVNVNEVDPRWTANESRVTNLETNMSNMNTTMNEAIGNISGLNATLNIVITNASGMNSTINILISNMSGMNSTLNTAIINISALNASILSLNNLSYAQIAANIGNWTLDKTSYYTMTQVEALGNLTNYYNKTTIDVNISGLQGAINNDRINITNHNATLTEAIGNISGMNTTLNIAIINISALNASILSLNNLSYAQIAANIGNWTFDKTSYYTMTQVEALGNLTNYYNKTTSDNRYLQSEANYSADNATIARVGNCSVGQFVTNTTNTGVICAAPSGSGTVQNIGISTGISSTSGANLTTTGTLTLDTVYLQNFNETAAITNDRLNISAIMSNFSQYYNMTALNAYVEALGNLTNYYNKTTIDTNTSALQGAINNDRINISNHNASILAIDTNVSSLQGAINNDRINISNLNSTMLSWRSDSVGWTNVSTLISTSTNVSINAFLNVTNNISISTNSSIQSNSTCTWIGRGTTLKFILCD